MSNFKRNARLQSSKRGEDSVRLCHVDRGCSLLDFARVHFGNAELVDLLCELNPTLTPDANLEAGDMLRIPNPHQAHAFGVRRGAEQTCFVQHERASRDAECLRLVRGDDKHRPDSLASFVTQAARAGRCARGVVTEIEKRATHLEIELYCCQPSTTGFDAEVKTLLQNRCTPAMVRASLRRWCEVIAQTLEPAGWLDFLRGMQSPNAELMQLLRVLGVPAPLILLCQRLAPEIVQRAESVLKNPVKTAVCLGGGDRSAPAETAAVKALRVSLASGFALMHPNHLQYFGAEVLHQTVSHSLLRVVRCFQRGHRAWVVLSPAEQARWSKAYAGAEVEGASADDGPLEVFRQLQARWGGRLAAGQRVAAQGGLTGLTGLLRAGAEQRPRNTIRASAHGPGMVDEALAQAVTGRLVDGVVRIIANDRHMNFHHPSGNLISSHPRYIQAMLTTSRDVVPNVARVRDYVARWTEPGGRASRSQPPEVRAAAASRTHIDSFIARLDVPISVGERNLSDLGIACLLVACAQSQCESGWFHPELGDGFTRALLQTYAGSVLVQLQERANREGCTLIGNTKSLERTRGCVYALRA